MEKEEVQKGLEGIVVAESKLGFIDGLRGRLLYHGYDIHDLAMHSSFEEVSYLLAYGKLPSKKELANFDKKLRGARHIPENIIKMMHYFCRHMTPMEALRTTVSALACGDPDARKVSMEAQRNVGIDLIAKFPTIVATYYRIHHNMKIVKPNEKLNHAANFLYMFHGTKPDDVSVKAMDMDFVLHAEHGFNASTFAARVTISTLSDMHSAITSAIGALKGPLHGGAAEEAMRMLGKIKSVKEAEDYVKEALARHERIMGFGHRVYKTMDPRAEELKKMSRALAEKGGNKKLVEISERIEEVMLREKNLYPNVDFYSASVYNYLGIPLELYSPIFAIGRIPGWVAHVLEQYADNRLIRPREKYTGEQDLKYIPIDERI